jgi:Holliday junction resolvase RusA-like endonuclease
MECFCIVFHIEHPRTWRKWKIAANVGKPHQSKPDADNLLKAMFDAIIPKKNRSKGEKGRDDKELWCYAVFKYWAADGGGKIEVLEYDKEEYLNMFGV